jgi:hypothetical protein
VFCQIQGGADAPSNQTECLVEGSATTSLDVVVRFLRLTERIVGELARGESLESFRSVESLRIGGREYHHWQEAEECDIDLAGVHLSDLVQQPMRKTFALPGRRWLEPLRGEDGEIGGVLVREQQAIDGMIEAAAVEVARGRFKVTLRVSNQTPLSEALRTNRDAALLRTLVSTHVILGIRDGEFVSLLDPPESWRELAAACRNVGTWPILVGEEGDKDTLLSSPIILYDYPQIAPESAGDLYDGLEIDEILTLRILTLTEDEKRAAASLDERTRDLMARTESLAREQLSRLHGTLRPLLGDKT